MEKTQARVYLFLGLIILAGVLVYIQSRVQPQITEQSTDVFIEEVENTFSFLDETSIPVVPIVDSSIPYLDIVAEYPKGIVGDTEIQSIVENGISQFKKEYTFYVLDEFSPTAESQYTLSVDYSTTHSLNFVTHVLEVFTYTGGAHGGTDVQTYSFDVHGNQLSLQDMLSEPDGLIQLSKKIRSILSTEEYKDLVNIEWLEEGAGPNMQNFSAFTFNSTGITFIFQQYQIGPYVSGIIEVPLTFLELKDIVKPEYLK